MVVKNFRGYCSWFAGPPSTLETSLDLSYFSRNSARRWRSNARFLPRWSDSGLLLRWKFVFDEKQRNTIATSRRMKKDRSVFPYLVRAGSFVPISLLVQLAENGSPLDLRDPYPATFLSTISITSIHRRGHSNRSNRRNHRRRARFIQTPLTWRPF